MATASSLPSSASAACCRISSASAVRSSPQYEVPGPNARPAGPLGTLDGRLAVHDRHRLGVSALPLEGLGQDPHRGRAAPGVHRGAGQALGQLMVEAGGSLPGRLQQQRRTGGHAGFQLPGAHPQEVVPPSQGAGVEGRRQPLSHCPRSA